MALSCSSSKYRSFSDCNNRYIAYEYSSRHSSERSVGIKHAVRAHQASDIAKLWQEFLSLHELIARIGCAVSKSNKSSVAEAMRTPACCRCHSDDFCSHNSAKCARDKRTEYCCKYGYGDCVAQFFGFASGQIHGGNIENRFASARNYCGASCYIRVRAVA